MSGLVGGGRHVPVLNPANALTAMRMAAVPVFVVLVAASGMERPELQLAACVLFCLASATDYLDGWIARNWDMVTSFGKVADPIADKALIGSALVLLSAFDRVPVWVTVIILTREIAVTMLRFWVIRRAVIAASRGGKAKTALQTLAIALCLAPLPPLAERVGLAIMMVAMVVTVLTGVDYFHRAVRLHRAPRPARLQSDHDPVEEGDDLRIGTDPAVLARAELAAEKLARKEAA
ncbi:MAG: CDP-diacylglycerol--glycerol-3-phosphate 3-phosphatidyltransferase [Micromonosporaceae bacterium]|nr:CDP-diacylglycerol--glycerol-3-phosphate 3-phosphatidyltransferase [Micromonosporaceae bacterium]